MNTYLVTPKRVLGSDSFTVRADSYSEAIEKAAERIKAEDWYAEEWEVWQLVAHYLQGASEAATEASHG